MVDIKFYKKVLVGQKLKSVLHTNQTKGETHLDGLGYMYYFRTVIELENGEKYCFGNDWIEKWNDSILLKEVTHKNWHIDKKVKFKTQTIIDIITNEEQELYFLLKNNILIYHTIHYGDKLYFEPYDSVFDTNGNFIQ